MARKGAPTCGPGALPAEHGSGADAFQRPLRSRFQARLTAGVRRQNRERNF
jgi:hypothetical protein